MAPGRGKFSGRGAKGAKSISGYSRMADLKAARCRCIALGRSAVLPTFSQRIRVVNVRSWRTLDSTTAFDPGRLLELGVIKKLKHGLKILGTGELKRKIRSRRTCFRVRQEQDRSGGRFDRSDQQAKQA